MAEIHRSLLHEARLGEAQALLRLNQRRRAQAEATLVAAASLSVGLAVIAVLGRRTEPLLLLPSLALLLTSWSLQQYVEVTVLGMARRRLEKLAHETLGGAALIYESHVAGIRHRSPLVGSLRVLQAIGRGLTVASVIVGAIVVASESQWAITAYVVATLVTGTSCVLSYRDMIKAAAVAERALADLAP